MADSSPAPGYYSGPPVVTHGKHKAPPSEPEPEPEPEPVDGGQVNASVPGYYSGGPAARPGGAGGGQGSAAPKESGFFAGW